MRPMNACQMAAGWHWPDEWAEILGLPNVGPIAGDYPISKDEFLARQKRYNPLYSPPR